MVRAPFLGMIAVDDRFPPEFGRQLSVMRTKVSIGRHRAATTAIAKPRGTQRSCGLDARSVTPSITRAREGMGLGTAQRPARSAALLVIVGPSAAGAVGDA